MKLIFLLLFISTARSKAAHVWSITPKTTTEPTLIPDFSALNELENKDAEQEGEQNSRNWDCPQDENAIRYRLEQTTQMLDEGDKVVNEISSSPQETILVLGEAGSGKTSLVQFLAGDNSKIFSKEIGKDSGEFLIEDGVKIGSSTVDSFTLYPELQMFNSSIAFCDTPGFRDSRSTSHEIVATSVMKKFMNKFKNVKILILCEYSSLKYGGHKNSFTDLLRYVNNLISNMEKYKESIVLVATKVPPNYVIKDGNFTLVSDSNMKNRIAEYVRKVKTTFEEKTTKGVDVNEKEYYANIIILLESLGQTDSDGNLKKINIFRSPDELGSIANISSLQENKQSLLSTVFNNIRYTKTLPGDFDYTLSEGAKNYLDCVLRYVNEKVVSLSNHIYNSITEYYRQIIETSTSLHEQVVQLKDISARMGALEKVLDNATDYNSYLTILESYAKNENISNLNYENDTIIDSNVYIKILEKFVDTRTILTPESWSSPIKHVLRYITDESNWYTMLKNIFENLSSYKIQRDKDVIYKNAYKNISTRTSNVKVFFTNAEMYKLVIDFKDFDELLLKEERVMELHDVILSTIVSKSNITCDRKGTLTITGNYVRISEINTADIIRTHCGSNPLKEIIILAVNTVFIDANIEDEIFRSVDMLIAAHTWEVVGKREIILKGVDGGTVVDNLYDLNDGKPGLPGGNGGNFFGIGLNFVNGAGLLIKSNGGAGGPGVDGKPGRRGESGASGYDQFIVDPPSDTNSNYTLEYGWDSHSFPLEEVNSTPVDKLESTANSNYFNQIYVYERLGNCGGKGTVGGNGGVGGVGGNPGRQKLIELTEPSKINLVKSPGVPGLPGSGGLGGPRGRDGIGMRCYKIDMYYDNSLFPRYWNCQNTTTYCERTDLAGSSGLSNQTATGILPPHEVHSFDISPYLFEYTYLLEHESSNKLFNAAINEFKGALHRKFPRDSTTLWELIYNIRF